MAFARGHAFNLADLFTTFRHKNIKLTCNECALYFNDRHKLKVAYLVFRECVKLVMEDVLENNVTFKFNGNKADIHMEKICGDAFKEARQKGAFADIDFLKTNFTAYRPYLYMYGYKVRKKPIKTHSSYTKRLDDYVNNGRVYC